MRFIPSSHRTLVILVLTLPLGVAQPATGELVLPAQNSWGVDSSLARDEIIEYLLCDSDGACDVLGSGDRAKAGSPIQLDLPLPGVKTLRARYCIADLQGSSTGDCGPLSDASVPFRFDGALPLKRFISHSGDVGGPSLHLVRMARHEVIIPLGMSLPVVNPELKFDVAAPKRGGHLQVVVKGVTHPWRRYFKKRVSFDSGRAQFSQPFPGLLDALRHGETSVRLLMTVRRGELLIGQGDPTRSDVLRAPHITGGTLFGTLIAFFDADADGVPYWPSRDTQSCESQQWTNCSDNCLYQYNPDQADAGSDGVGDVCEGATSAPLSALGDD